VTREETEACWKDPRNHRCSKLRIGGRACAILILVFLGLGYCCAFIVSRAAEPKYQAKALRYWLKGYRVADEQWNDSTPQKADEAVIHLGTNVIPTLLTMLRARDSALDVKLHSWGCWWNQFAKKHHLIKDAPIPRLASCDVEEAGRAFAALGPEARFAVPGLIKLLDGDPPSISKRAIATVLGQMGPRAKDAIAALVRITTDPDVLVQERALSALGDIASEPELSVPALIRGLTDESASAFVVKAASLGLKAFGPNAKAAAPALIDALKRWETGHARLAAMAARDPQMSIPIFDDPSDALKEALEQIDPEAAAKMTVK
jgi:hypothetical protein